MKSLLLFAILLSGSAYSYESKIYKYEIGFSKLRFDARNFDSKDVLGILTARTLRKIKGMTENCIDLGLIAGPLKIFYGDDVEVTGGIDLISSQNISAKMLEEKLIEQCQFEFDLTDEDDNCKITVERNSANLDESYLGFRIKSPVGNIYINYLKKIISMPPMMSYACITGWNQDHSNDSASTPAAKKYLKGMELNREYLKKGYGVYLQDPNLEGAYVRFFQFGLIQDNE